MKLFVIYGLWNGWGSAAAPFASPVAARLPGVYRQVWRGVAPGWGAVGTPVVRYFATTFPLLSQLQNGKVGDKKGV